MDSNFKTISSYPSNVDSAFHSEEPFRNLEILARQLVEGFITGRHKSPHHGFSVEFAEHRFYNEGQSTRHIDWKVFARTDRLYTKQYEEETNLRCLIAIDCSPSMYYPTVSRAKLRFSIHSAAAIAYLLHRQRDAFGLCLFSDKIDEMTPIKSTSAHLRSLFQMMERKNKNNKQTNTTNVSSVLHEIANKVHRRSLIIIFSDLFDNNPDEIMNALQHLKHKHHEVLLFHTRDHETEMNFTFQEKPYEFVDMETQEKIKINPAEVRETFVRQLDQFQKKIKLRCGQLKIDLIDANVQTGYAKILETYLNKRLKMR